MKYAKGDVLILSHSSYHDPVIAIYDHEYRPHSAHYAYDIKSRKMFYDRDWNIFEFVDADVLIKLENATREYNEFVSKLGNVIKRIKKDITSTLGVSTKKHATLLKEEILDDWVKNFLPRKYKEHMELFKKTED